MRDKWEISARTYPRWFVCILRYIIYGRKLSPAKVRSTLQYTYLTFEIAVIACEFRDVGASAAFYCRSLV